MSSISLRWRIFILCNKPGICFITYYSDNVSVASAAIIRVAYSNTEWALQDGTIAAFTAGLITGYEPRLLVQYHNGLAAWQLCRVSNVTVLLV
jgi:hypothetical protein